MSEMSYMEKLLEGADVKAIPLGDVAEIKRGTSITLKGVTPGEVPVIAGGRTPAYFHNTSNRTGQTIVIAGSGAYAGFVSWWDQPIFVSDAFTVKPHGGLRPKYCFYWLQSMQQQVHDLKSGGGVPHVYPKDVAPLLIPIPCPENPEKSLAIQKEIVRILDTFTELTNRKKQYNHYRDQLLSFKEGDVAWKALGEICDFKNGFAFKSSLFHEAGFPIIRITNIDGKNVTLDDVKYFDPSDYREELSSFIVEPGNILVAMSGATTGKIGIYSEKRAAYLNQRVGKFVPRPKLLSNRYLYHNLLSRSQEMLIMAGGGAQPNLSSNALMDKLRIPIPYPNDPERSLAEQARIASILDKFDTLTHSISEGLPREIELRQKQYEHYRDLLLSFPKPEVAA